MFSSTKAHACDLVIFGTKGDLARRKLLPSLYHLEKAGHLEGDSRIIGVGRAEWSHDDYVDMVKNALQTFLNEPLDDTVWQALSARLLFCNLDVNDTEGFQRLGAMLDQDKRVTISYFALHPDNFSAICHGLGEAGLNHPPSRVVMEKPLGTHG